MSLKFLLLAICLFVMDFNGQSQSPAKLSINGFNHWFTGRDSATVQFIPVTGNDALSATGHKIIAHVKFRVAKYGEVSFPVKPSDAEEAPPVNLGNSRYIKITYKANHEVILQLRQTGIHGGVHNHIILPASLGFITRTLYFSSFKNGLSPLDLSNVSKFNFAFLGNNEKDGYAELTVRSFKIDQYKP